jgi:UDP:flavonoid glycosyltransferase YjiC (YdhE family)/2-polyprenyl-3-methyl-5-hydroxy-6-metoxy-1,4-benzoquinol methylase
MSTSATYVIAATPRAATAYIAKLLTNLNLRCGHELYFKFEQRWHAFASEEQTHGDASWLVVPFLKNLPPHVHILHQVRHPLNVIRSLLQIRFADLDERHRPVRTGLGLQFTQFAYRHCPALLECTTNRERAIWFYYHWNRLVAHAGRPVLRYQIEELGPDRLRQLLDYIGVPAAQVPTELLKAHFDLLPRNINAKTREKVPLTEDLRWEELPGEVQELARSYGYGPPDERSTQVAGWTETVAAAEQALRRQAEIIQLAWSAERAGLSAEIDSLRGRLRCAEDERAGLQRELAAAQHLLDHEHSRTAPWHTDGGDGLAGRAACDRWLGRTILGSRVLDVGCRDGKRAIALAREGLDVSAVDQDAAVIQGAQMAAVAEDEATRARLHFQQGTLSTLEFEPATFDTVILDDLLTRALQPERLLTSAAHALRPGGRLALTITLAADPADEHRQPLRPSRLAELFGHDFTLSQCEVVGDYLCVAADRSAAGDQARPVPAAVMAGWDQAAIDALLRMQRGWFIQRARLDSDNEKLRGELERKQAELTAATERITGLNEQLRRLESRLDAGTIANQTTRDLLVRAQTMQVRLARAMPDFCEHTAAGPSASPAGGGVLFFCVNGAGLGHLTRSLAVARRLRRLDPELPVYFLTSSQALRCVSVEGIVPYHVPPRSEFGDRLSSSDWNTLLLQTLRTIVATHRPPVLVYDGVSPYQGLMRAIAEAGFAYTAMILRLRHKHDRLTALVDRLGQFDELLFPGERDVAIPPALAGLPHHTFNPIIHLDRDELLPRAQARRQLRIPSDRKAVYIQLGAGNINDNRAWLDAVLAVLARRPDVDIVLAESPIAKESYDQLPGRHVLRQYPNSLYFNAFDLAITAVGYNTFHELLHFGVPAVLIPNQETVTDDQVARAQIAARAGAARMALAVGDLEEAINDLLADEAAAQARQCGMQLVPANGALSVAQHIIQAACERLAAVAPELRHATSAS